MGIERKLHSKGRLQAELLAPRLGQAEIAPLVAAGSCMYSFATYQTIHARSRKSTASANPAVYWRPSLGAAYVQSSLQDCTDILWYGNTPSLHEAQSSEDAR